MKPFQIWQGRGQLWPDTDPASIGRALDANGARDEPRRRTVQFDRPLPSRLLDAAAAALAAHPDVELYIYGTGLDPSLEGLERFQHVQHLSVGIRDVTTYEPIRNLRGLKSLVLQNGLSTSLSVDFVADLPELVRLYVVGVSRGVEALSNARSLRSLSCTAKAATLQALGHHPSLQFLKLTFGTARDLRPLATVARLRGLEIYQISELSSDDLDPLGDCVGLEALSLGALRHVTNLAPLNRLPSRTLRCLLLEKLTHLASFDDIGNCLALEQLGLFESRPADRSLAPLTRLPRLQHLWIGDVYPKAEIDHLVSQFAGASLHYRDKIQQGESKPAWRATVEHLLDEPDW
jgi:hypothetical protein